MSVYLDYNATTPIDPNVLDKMIQVYKNVIGNADSRTHDYGKSALEVTEVGRKQVAELLGINSNEIIFTSGATESNNIAIQGLDDYAQATGKKHIVSTSIEHKAVLNTLKYLKEKKGYQIDFINPDESGRVSVDDVLAHVKEDTLLVTIMHVNNETGIIQPVKEIGDALAEKEVFFHVDATQSCGKLVNEIRSLKYDMLSFSAHKFRGPQGIGVLALRRRHYKLPPVKGIYFGGQQEYGIRPGTIPVALIAGLGEACNIAAASFEKEEEENKQIKHDLVCMLEKSGLTYKFNGQDKYCISTTMNICFYNVSAEALMLLTKQYCALSNGSACTSKSYEPSYVLKAMGIPVDDIENSVRISWGSGVDKEQLLQNFSNLLSAANNLAG